MFYSKAKYGTPFLFWTRTILDVRLLAGCRNDIGRTRVPRRPNTLINDREPMAGHSDEARHRSPITSCLRGGPAQLHPRRLWEPYKTNWVA